MSVKIMQSHQAICILIQLELWFINHITMISIYTVHGYQKPLKTKDDFWQLFLYTCIIYKRSDICNLKPITKLHQRKGINNCCDMI